MIFDWISHHAPLIALMFFFGFFITMTVWIFRPGMGEKLKQDGMIPFKEEK